jgi:hypothetical protein
MKKSNLWNERYKVVTNATNLIQSHPVSISRPPRGIIHVSSRFRRDPRALEEEEETWFDQDDDEEQNGGDDVMSAVKSPEDDFKSLNSLPKKNDVLSPSPSNKVCCNSTILILWFVHEILFETSYITCFISDHRIG